MNKQVGRYASDEERWLIALLRDLESWFPENSLQAYLRKDIDPELADWWAARNPPRRQPNPNGPKIRIIDRGAR